MAREFTTVGVVGLGTMGAGIAEVFARGGYTVVGVERTQGDLERGQGHVQRSTDRAVKRGKLAEAEQEALLGRMRFTTSMPDLGSCDLVVEAIVERLAAKRAVFEELDGVVGPDAVLATNTSSLSVTEIAAATSRPERVLGMHFFNPAPVQRLVEVVSTVVTAPDVVEDVRGVAESLGKSPVSVGDKAGFIANALLFGYLNHACSMLESRYASRDDIDAAMRIGCGYPMGPLALLDLIGLDTAYEILTTMYHQDRDRTHAPAPILRQMVTAGLLGKKSGRGFYTYDGPGGKVVADDGTAGAAEEPGGRDVRTVAVVGSGDRAEGIAEACREAGLEVIAVPEGQEQTAGNADLVLTAGEEDATLFSRLDAVCRPGAILAATGSAVPVVELAAATGRPAEVVGMHVLDPAAGSGVVEVVSGVQTSTEVADTVRAVSARMGRHPVSCADRAGFVVEALLFPYLNDAVTMLQAHYASTADIDTAMKLGCALPKGPFEVLDEVGADVVLAAQRRLFAETREPGHAPAPLLEQLVTAGLGFREYSARS